MRLALAALFYIAAFVFFYAGFAIPGADGLNHHIRPQSDAEWLAVLLIVNGCAAKFLGHVILFSTSKRVTQ
jgi:hypothetical protein